MERSRPVYNEIKGLRKQLDDAGAVKKSRAASERLLVMLSDPDVRRRLAVEATPDAPPPGRSLRAIRRAALAEMWRVLIQSAITSAHLIARKGKSKLTNQDLRLPLKLLELCDKPDEVFDEATSKLGREQIKLLYSYCMTMLDDDQTLLIDGGEKTLLTMLAYICSRREFVAYFKPEQQISAILEEVEKRLLLDDGEGDSSCSPEIVQIAAKIFGNLLSTCQDLGIGLHLILPGTIKLVASWCHQNEEERSFLDETVHLLSGASILLRSNPDVAIAPLSRHGRPILQLVKRSLGKLDLQKASKPYVAALTEYLLRYLIVCQVAGKLQGLMPGDLGNLGPASLNYKTVTQLLDLLMRSISTMEKYTGGKLSELYKAQLELTARLFACAQRMYLIRNEWNELEDPMKEIISDIENQPIVNGNYFTLVRLDDRSSYRVCSPTTLAKAPFVTLILRHIYAVAPRSFRSSIATENGSQLESRCQHERKITSNLLMKALPLAMDGLAANEKTLISLLHIVSAAAEICPLGGCWTSSTQNNWRTLPVDTEGDNLAMEPVTVNGGSSEDLCAVVEVICNILEAHGGYNASSEMQKWVLVCLTRLTIATEACSLTVFTDSSSIKVAKAWRRVWSTLLCSNLSYNTLTKETGPGSNGDLVLRLLTQIVRFLCTDPGPRHCHASIGEAFILNRQSDIWRLPVYDQFDVRSPSAFMLIYVIVYSVVLCDDSFDSIGRCVSESVEWQSRIQQCSGGLRSKLVCYCLHYLEQSLDGWKDEKVICAASACIAALVNGFSASPTSVFFATNADGMLCLGLPQDFTITSMANVFRATVYEKPASEKLTSESAKFFSSLWAPPLDCPMLCIPPIIEDSMDIVRAELRSIYLLAIVRERNQKSANSLSRSQSSLLFDIASMSLEQTLSFVEDRDIVIEGRESDTDEGKIACGTISFSLRTTIWKCHLTLILSRFVEDLASSLENLSKDVSNLFQLASVNITSPGTDQEELAAVLSDLLRIARGLVNANSELALRWPCFLLEGASSLYDSCEALLNDYVVGDAPDENYTSSQMVYSEWDTLMDDNVPDGAVNPSLAAQRERDGKSRQKRKRQAIHSSRQRRRHSEVPMAKVSPTCSYLAGALFLALNPTFRDCEFVAKTLLGVDDLAQEADSDYDVDVWGGIYAVNLICSKQLVACLSAKNASSEFQLDLKQGSVVSLICDIIRTVRISAKPHSTAHMFGHFFCAEIVRLRDGNRWSTSLDIVETKAVVELLIVSESNQERRSCLLRPHFRAQQLRAATSAFRDGAENFHAEFDNSFGLLLLSALADISGVVRRHACRAVAAALLILTEDKVIESVRKRLPPVASQTTELDLQKQYRRWYANKSCVGGSSESGSTIENQAWDDTYLTMQCDVIACWSVIAETSSSREVLQQVLFDLVRLVFVRPSLEVLCYLAVERIAFRRGFGRAENLLDSENRNLAQRWLETGESLFDFPLMTCIPSTFRRLLRAGQAHLLSTKKNGNNFNWDLDKVRDVASSEFLSRGTHIFLPRILIMSVSTLVQTSVTKDGRRRLLENDFLKECCSVLCDHFDDEVAKKALQAHFVPIFAEALFLRTCSDEDSMIADEVMRLMKGLLTDDIVEQNCEKVAGLAVRRVIEIIGEATDSGNTDSQVNALRTFLKTNGKKSLKRGDDPFGGVGSSSIELLLLVKFHLDTSYNASQMLLRWNSADVVFRILGAHGHHLSFCLHILLSIILDFKIIPIRMQALRSLRDIVIAATLVPGFQSAADTKKLVGTILELHKNCQQNLMSTCMAFQRCRDKVRRQNAGILVSGNNGDIAGDCWGWMPVSDFLSGDVPLSALWRECHQYVSSSLVECLVATFDLLRIILQNGKSLGLSRDVVSCLRYESNDHDTYKALADVHQSFSAQLLISEFLKENFVENDEQDVSTIAMRLSSNVSSNQSFIQAELGEIERFLHQSRVAGIQQRPVRFQASEEILVVRALTQFCSKSVPRAIRTAASRCLGEMDLALDWHRPGSTSELTFDDDRPYDVIASGQLLKKLQADIIECLTLSLRSSDSRAAMVAVDTLKAVLSSRVGKDCLELITEPKTVSSLKSLVSNSKPLQKLKLFLTEHEVDQIRQGACRTNENEREWCWDDSFWKSGTNRKSSFESWICRLMPALLVCCYNSKDGKGKNSFFALCQRMSCLDPKIAQALFPAVLLDQLQSQALEEDKSHSDRVLVDTWIGRHDSSINIRLSRCFGSLLGNCADGYDRRVVELVVEVLDMLRRFTQEKFTSSSNHTRNKITRETTKMAATPWRGVPFGVVLTLDGKLVVSACIQSRRFEAALFYAELYADARFGGSNRCMELLALDNERRKQILQGASIRDVSGFCQRDEAESEIDLDSLAFLMMLRTSFAELGEEDAQIAVDQQESDFSFTSEQEGTLAMASLLTRDSPSLKKLQLLDNMIYADRRSVAIRLSVVDCLEGLGLRSALETYIAGLTFEGEIAFGDSNKEVLREKLYECRLYAMQWNDSLFQPLGHEAIVGTGNSEQPTDLPAYHLIRSDHGVGSIFKGDYPRSHQSSSRAGFYELMTGALDTLRRDEIETSCHQLREARLQFLDILSSFGTESVAVMSMHDAVDHLQILNDLEDFVASSGSPEMLLQRFGLLTKSAEEICYSTGSRNNFSECVREITLRALLAKPTSSLVSVSECLVSLLSRQFQANLLDGRHKAADGLIQRLHSLTRSVGDTDSIHRRLSLVRLRLQEASLFESRGDFTDAIRSTKLTIRHLQQKGDRDLDEDAALADALALCGKWIAKYKVEPANSILTNYLNPAVDISRTIYDHQGSKMNADRATKALLAQGQLVSNLFETISARVNSLEWQKAEASLNDREKELKSFDHLIEEAIQRLNAQNKKQQADPSNEVKKELKHHRINRHQLYREIEATRTQRITILHSMETHRTLTMKSIVSALTIAGVSESEDMSKHVYRLVGLWFSSDNCWTESIDRIIGEAVNNIPSFRFVPLVTQLFSQITNTRSQTISFQNRLQQLVRRISLQHPYHCLIHLIALSEGKSIVSNSEKANDKAQAAAAALRDLEKEDPQYVGQLIESYKKLAGAYVHLATADTVPFHRGDGAKISFDKVCKNAAIRLDRCLGSGSRTTKFPPSIFTKPPLIRPACDYGDEIHDPIGSERVASFESSFTITDTGLNRPKIVVCIGSKGSRFKQLVKGEDDTRQDAVMEQVFGYVNELMARQRRTYAGEGGRSAKYDLRLVTYNVLPLNHRAGVLEWVQHSMPFGDFIADKAWKQDSEGNKSKGQVGAHSRYYPGEWSSPYCRKILQTLREEFKARDDAGGESKARDDQKQLRSAFDLICHNYSPVFRFFFVEKFVQPEIWYASKMRYTRSVAVSSVVGHILGIGDRHGSNILVHQRTGEVIHIDFGVVFEQGKLLNSPEHVPFRLTQNVVDGMGPLGTEGTFTKAAEATLSALQQNANGLLTILSAIVSDPLYKWSVGSTMACHHEMRQSSIEPDEELEDLAGLNSVAAYAITRDENRNELAAHAIARIHEKLLGYEDGTSGEQQSVESQMQLLVNAARDPDNLCDMFPGWAPWV